MERTRGNRLAAVASASLAPLLAAGLGHAQPSAPNAYGGLLRQPYWGARLAPSNGGRPGVLVRSLDPSSPAAAAGLRAGDVLRQVNDCDLRDPKTLAVMMRSLRAGDSVLVHVERERQIGVVRFALPPMPLERIPGADVLYDAVTSPLGYRIRIIATRPAGVAGRLPTIVFIPWLSCDSAESPLGAGDGWSHLLHGLAQRSGFALVRIEKPGVGDSEGPPCSENDLRADLSAYRAALAALDRIDFVDTSRVILFGGSIGGSLAPILAAERHVRGVIVSGGFTGTWYEHMLEIERTRRELAGVPPGEINAAMRGVAELYLDYLYGGRTPGEVVRDKPRLAPLWDDEPDGQYGRPAAFFQQVAALNVEEAWEKVDAPVLILYGEYDWIMSRSDQERILEIVNARRPDRARLALLPRTDHNLDVYASRLDAFHGRGGRFDDALVGRVIEWLRAQREIHVSHP